MHQSHAARAHIRLSEILSPTGQEHHSVVHTDVNCRLVHTASSIDTSRSSGHGLRHEARSVATQHFERDALDEAPERSDKLDTRCCRRPFTAEVTEQGGSSQNPIRVPSGTEWQASCRAIWSKWSGSSSGIDSMITPGAWSMPTLRPECSPQSLARPSHVQHLLSGTRCLTYMCVETICHDDIS